MLKKLMQVILFTTSLFSYEIIVDETLKNIFNDNEKSTKLIRNEKLQIVYDPQTSLMWKDDIKATTIKTSWNNAKYYCQNLVFSTYNDWYLPSISDFEKIIDYSNIKSNNAMQKEFKNVKSSYYWSSTEDIANNMNAWIMYVNDGESSQSEKSNKLYVRCVRFVKE